MNYVTNLLRLTKCQPQCATFLALRNCQSADFGCRTRFIQSISQQSFSVLPTGART